jgi:hypothetical protein
VAEQDPQSFERLFEAEPDAPSEGEAAEWIQLYTGLTQLLRQQLDSTRQFAAGAPAAMREYLESENVKILAGELKTFQERLAFWRRRNWA